MNQAEITGLSENGQQFKTRTNNRPISSCETRWKTKTQTNSAVAVFQEIQNEQRRTTKKMSTTRSRLKRPLTSSCGSIVHCNSYDTVGNKASKRAIQRATTAVGALRRSKHKPVVPLSLANSSRQNGNICHVNEKDDFITKSVPTTHKRMPSLVRPWTSNNDVRRSILKESNSCSASSSSSSSSTRVRKLHEHIEMARCNKINERISSHHNDKPWIDEKTFSKRQRITEQKITIKKKKLTRCASSSAMISNRDAVKEIGRLKRKQTWPPRDCSSSFTKETNIITPLLEKSKRSMREKKEYEKERYRAEIYEINRIMKAAFDAKFAEFMKMKMCIHENK